jgi:hypothetical protein
MAFACSDAASSKALHGEVIAAKKKEVRHQTNTDTKTTRSDISLKTDASSSSQPDNAITTSSIAVKPETPQTSQFDDQSDPAIKKAKATVTAKMGNPASVEFVEIKRASGANALGNSSDIVCGFVKRRTQAVSISCSKRRGVYRRLQYSYERVPPHLLDHTVIAYRFARPRSSVIPGR